MSVFTESQINHAVQAYWQEKEDEKNALLRAYDAIGHYLLEVAETIKTMCAHYDLAEDCQGRAIHFVSHWSLIAAGTLLDPQCTIDSKNKAIGNMIADAEGCALIEVQEYRRNAEYAMEQAVAEYDPLWNANPS